MRDTTPAAEERYYALLAERSPIERLAISLRLTRSVRELAESSIRERYPHATEERVRWLLTERLYGREVAERLFGRDRADSDAAEQVPGATDVTAQGCAGA